MLFPPNTVSSKKPCGIFAVLSLADPCPAFLSF